MLCQEAIHATNVPARNHYLDYRGLRSLNSVDQPFVDNWSWRQSDVATIARNYFQGGFHLARPQIDWAGDQPGYVGTEFPILPFLAAISYKFLGIHEWVGRIQAVSFFRYLAAILLFARARDVGRNRRDLGVVFLIFRAARDYGEPMFHAGHAVARSFADGFVFLPALAATRKLTLFFSERTLHFVVDFD